MTAAKNSATTVRWNPSPNISCSNRDEIRAEHHVRQPDGSWLFREIANPAVEISLDSIGCRMRLDSLYERVEFGS